MSDLNPHDEEDVRPLPRHLPEVEYEDEPPGSYLAEFRANAWTVAWSAATLALEAVLAFLWFGDAFPADSETRAAARIVWTLVPVSAAIALVVALWLMVVEARRPPSYPAILTAGFAVIALVAWWILVAGYGVLPALEEGAGT